MSNIDELLELFLAWMPLFVPSLIVSRSLPNDPFQIRGIDSRNLNPREKLAFKVKAASFHYANKHLCNMMFSGDEVIIGPKFQVVPGQTTVGFVHSVPTSGLPSQTQEKSQNRGNN